MVLSGILNGLGKQIFVFRNNLIASGINLFFIYFFIPYKGIIAFIFGWLASLIVACLLDLNVITKTIDIKLKFDELILKPFLATTLSGLIANFFAKNFILAHKFLNNIYGLAICTIFFGLIYIFFVLMTGSAKINELKKLMWR